MTLRGSQYSKVYHRNYKYVVERWAKNGWTLGVSKIMKAHGKVGNENIGYSKISGLAVPFYRGIRVL